MRMMRGDIFYKIWLALENNTFLDKQKNILLQPIFCYYNSLLYSKYELW